MQGSGGRRTGSFSLLDSLQLPWPAGSPVLVACSGGADSLALLYLLRHTPWPVQVAYLDHGAHSQSETLRALCLKLNLPFHTRKLKVGAWARRYGWSWEAAGRHLRYNWLRRVAARENALLVTGHTADDQAETVLLRLLQGTTLTGLESIRSHSPGLYRPLLGLRRQQLRDYLSGLGVSWWEDPMNEEQRFLRVALRRRVLPVLEELNSGVVDHLCQIAEDAGRLRQSARPEEMPAVLPGDPLGFEEWLHQAWTRLNQLPGARWERHHSQRISASVRLRSAGRWDLPGKIWAEWDGRRLRLGRTLNRLPELCPGGHDEGLWQIVRTAHESLEWRTRQPGDRWRGRTLKKCFHDWRIPGAWRQSWPILVKPPHEVIWVPGYAADNQPGDVSYSLGERNALLTVEAAARDETAPR